MFFWEEIPFVLQGDYKNMEVFNFFFNVNAVFAIVARCKFPLNN